MLSTPCRALCRARPVDAARLTDKLVPKALQKFTTADASIMPRIVASNTNAPALMIGEKGADLILGRAPLPAGQFALRGRAVHVRQGACPDVARHPLGCLRVNSSR